MPNLDPCINYENENHHTITEQEEGTTNKSEKYLLSIRDECQKMIRPKSHSTYNERPEKISSLDRLDLKDIERQ